MALLAPPSIPVFPAGYGPVASSFDGWVQDSLGFQTTGIVFRAEQTTNQSLSGGAENVIAFNTVLEDPYSGWSSGSSLWLAPYTGWYEVTITATIAAVSSTVAAQLQTPEGYFSLALTSQAGTFFGGTSGYAVVPLVGGSDWVKASINPSVSTTTNNVNVGRYTTMEISFVSQ